MADKDYYAHQHSQRATRDSNVVPVNSLRTRVDGAGGVTHAREGVTQAVGNVFAAYKAPPRRHKDDPTKVLCAEEGCKAFPMKELEFCTGHARSKGLIEKWGYRGRETE